ncbi:hypothetical protein [Candidatus Poriferisodalis sp.]|uniref:hypothetical protein n=1 Tax=Candidatus Poriferisodalis sp. TaxID=3101277 RepID=UPI003B0217BC
MSSVKELAAADPDIIDPDEAERLHDLCNTDKLTTQVEMHGIHNGRLLDPDESLATAVDVWLHDTGLAARGWTVPTVAVERDRTWRNIDEPLILLRNHEEREILWLQRLRSPLGRQVEDNLWDIVCDGMCQPITCVHRLSSITLHPDPIWRHVAAWLHDDPAELAMLALDTVEHVRHRAAMRLKESATG